MKYLYLSIFSLSFSITVKVSAQSYPGQKPSKPKEVHSLFADDRAKGYGVILMSFSFDRREQQDGYTYQLFWKGRNEEAPKNIHRDTRRFVQPSNNSYGPNVVTDSIVTLYRLQIMPVGKYTFHNFMITEHYGNAFYELSQPGSFDIPFEVIENKISYIGDYLFLKEMRKAIFGKVMKDGILIVSNRMPLDLQKVSKSKFNEIDFSELIIQRPKFGDTSMSPNAAVFIKD